MILPELEALVSAGESETLEFKKSTGELAGGTHTCCGFLNGRGGTVLYGVKDDGTLAGQDVTDATRREVVNELRRIEPFVPLQPEEVPLPNGRRVLVVRVPAVYGSGPYTHDGRPYLRQSAVTMLMPRVEYERRLTERMHPTHRWELQPATGLTLANLDAAEITRTVDEGIRRGRLPEPGTRDPLTLLQHLKLADEQGALRNAAVVLFARPEGLLPHYPQVQLKLARFDGTTRTAFLDSQVRRGHAFLLMAEAQHFMRRHLPVAGRIVPTLFERVDDPLYPPEALREALANAFCHRDYSIGGGSVSVGIYDDRLEITSTGRLPFGLTPADLQVDHTSQPWNPLIADVFYVRGLIESWGRGTLRMIELSRKADLVAPEFEEVTGSVLVRFRPLHYTPATLLSPLQRTLLEVLDAGAMSLSALGRHAALAEASPNDLRAALRDLRARELADVAGRGAGARWFRR